MMKRTITSQTLQADPYPISHRRWFILRAVRGPACLVQTLGCIAICLLAVVWLPKAVRCEQRTVLHWSDVLRLMQKQPLLSQARARLVATQKSVAVLRQAPNPNLDAHFGQGFARHSEDKAWEWGLSITMPLEWLFIRKAEVQRGEADVQQAEQEARRIRNDVLHQLAVLFWSLAYEQAQALSLKESEAQVLLLEELVRKRVEHGEARPSERSRIEIEVEKIRIERLKNEALLLSHQIQLEQHLGISPSRGTLVVEPDHLSPIPGLQNVLDRLEQHPLFKANGARIQATKAAIESEKNKRIPAVNVSVGYDVELDRRSIRGFLQMDLPLWNWNTARIEEARAKQIVEEKNLESIRLELRNSIVDAHSRCQRAQETTQHYREKILPAAQHTVTMLEKSFRLGECSLLEVLDAQKVLQETRRDVLSAELDERLTCTAMKALTGELENE